MVEPLYGAIQTTYAKENIRAMKMLDKEGGTDCTVSNNKLSLVVRKPVFGVSDQVRHKPAVQPQEMARGLKFRI